MEINMEKVFLIMSKDNQLIAKGTPRNRYIHHINETNKKRLLTYSSKGMAESAFKNSGFYLSAIVTEYIKQHYPELRHEKGYVYWEQVECLFEAREFKVTYKEV